MAEEYCCMVSITGREMGGGCGNPFFGNMMRLLLSMAGSDNPMAYQIQWSFRFQLGLSLCI